MQGNRGDVWQVGIKRTHYGSLYIDEDAMCRVPGASLGEGSHIARNMWSSCAGSTRWITMRRQLRILLANVGKRPMVQYSIMNNEELRDYGLIIITEPTCFRNEDG